MSIELRNISKTFGSYTALKDINLVIPSGELVALLGPSGSGKTTMLRIIAGLDTADAAPGAQILFSNQNVNGEDVGGRNVGFVFQHYALFRHMTVFENIAFGLRVRPRKVRPSKKEIHRKVSELLRLIQLDSLGDRHPSQLSGGQRQRVALARALAIEPKVLLLDEPFGALDAKVRLDLRKWLRRLHDEIHVTSVLVTHDQEEAMEVADRVVVMNNARIEQVGTPIEVFHQPATPFVMNFLGSVNLFHGRIANGRVEFGGVAVPAPGDDRTVSDAKIFIRPHDFELTNDSGDRPAFPATVTRINAAGPIVRIDLVAASGDPVQVELTQQNFHGLDLCVGGAIFVSPKAVKVFIEPALAGSDR
jgi:sulfate transport system ATP-binding protein